MKLHSHLGTFRGSELSEVELDAILAFAFSKDDIEAGRAFFETKWWDYRFIHPGYCFFLYAHEYGEAVTRWRSMFGVSPYAVMSATDHPIFRRERSRKGNTTTFTGKHILAPASYRTGLWRGMTFADAYGVPYDRWVELAFQWAFESKWERIPQPTALYTTGAAEFILDRWEEEKKDLLRLPADPIYLVENDQGHRWQRAEHEWLLGLIKARPQPAHALAQYGFKENRVPLDLAEARLGRPTVERAAMLAISR